LSIELDDLQRTLKTIPFTVAELLRSDDHTLTELNQRWSALSEQDQTSSELEATQARSDRLTQALRQFQVSAVKDRLDRVYLESLHAIEDEQTLHSTGTTNDIQQDLDSLYEEIDDVVNLLVEHGHGGVLKSTLRRVHQQRIQQSRITKAHIHDRLASLSSTLSAASQSLEQFQLRRLSLQTLNKDYLALSRFDESASRKAPDVTQTSRDPINRASTVLLDHLGLDAGSSQCLAPNHSPSRAGEFVRAKDEQSANTLSQTLRHFQEAADERDSSIKPLLSALSSNTSHTDLQHLERQVTALKIALENAL
jgi:hypothetical protein